MRLQVKTLLSISLLFLFFVVFNTFLTSHYFEKWIFKYNQTSYFYLTHDWLRKINRANTKLDQESIVFIGSSRTAYGVHQLNHKNKIVNLGLIGGSVYEMLQISKILSDQNTQLKKIYVEINPMSFRKRHISAMRKEELHSFFEIDFLKRTFPWLTRVSREIPLYENRFVIRETFRDIFEPTSNFSDDYLSARKKNAY